MTVPRPDQFHDFGVRPLDSLDGLLACEEAKSALIGVLRRPSVPPKLMLLGPPGSGKSTLVNGAIRLVACENPRGLLHCGNCRGCDAYDKTGGKEKIGLHAIANYQHCKRTIEFLPINCRSTTIDRVRRMVACLRGSFDSLRIIHLEEAASLQRGRLDETITDLMDDPDFATCRWIATAVTDAELDEQFRRRWAVKVTTTAPEPDELARDLARYCRRFGIGIDHPSTWQLLADQSWSVVGQARSLIAMALLKNPPMLTHQMVRAYPFPKLNPWKEGGRSA